LVASILIGKHEKHRNHIFFEHDQIVENQYFLSGRQSTKLKNVFLGNVWGPGDRVAKESLKRNFEKLRLPFAAFFSLLQNPIGSMYDTFI